MSSLMDPANNRGHHFSFPILAGVAACVDGGGDFERSTVLIQVPATGASVYLGFDDSVDDTNGFELVAGASISFDLTRRVAIYAYCQSVAELRCMEVG